MKYLFLILSLVCLSVFGQTGPESYWRFENSGNDDMGNHNLTAKTYADYTTSEKIEGSYGGDLNLSGGNRFVTNNKIDLSTGAMTLNFYVKRYNTSGTVVIFTNRATDTGQGLTVYLDEANGRIRCKHENRTNRGGSLFG